LLGFSFAFLTLDCYRAASIVDRQPVFPVIVAAVPLLDAIFAIARRILGKTTPFVGDRHHYYDLLVARGLLRRTVVLISYALTACLVAIGWLSERLNSSAAIVLAICCWALLLGIGLWLGLLRRENGELTAGFTSEREIPEQGVFPNIIGR
jgi:fructose-specific phosphotransferase system IIC component